jgi:hypothetical protein
MYKLPSNNYKLSKRSAFVVPVKCISALMFSEIVDA